MAEPEDQLIFELAEGQRRRLTKSVPAGEGESVLSEILNSDKRWIQVGDSMYINSERVTSIELKRSTDPSRPLAASI